MRWSLRLAVLLCLALFVLAPASPTIGATSKEASISEVALDDLPEEIEREIDKKTEGLPEEVREKIKEKMKEALKKLKEGGELPEGVAIKAKKSDNAGKADGESQEGEDASDADAKSDESKKSKEETAKEDPLSAEVKKLQKDMQLMETRFKFRIAEYKQELEDKRFKIEKMKLDQDIEKAFKLQCKAKEHEKLKDELEKLTLESSLAEKKAKLQMSNLGAELAEIKAIKTKIEARLETEAAEKRIEDIVLKDEKYFDQPFRDGVLWISDRRIELNGLIFTGAAKYVCDRINYYNNQSDKPIFLIIDSSPGGSGMEGLHIVQAMQNSKAPIHVVVKRYAASMAAIITTLADHSYAYPDAIILHHQAQAMTSGSVKSMEEQAKRIQEMSRRLVGEVAEKLGTTEEKFVEQMYKHRITGDWDLFADKAVKRDWVGHVVREIRETSVRNRPTEMRSQPSIFRISGSPDAVVRDVSQDRYEIRLEEQTDEKGRCYIRLPRISPLDAWFLYNPDGYYR